MTEDKFSYYPVANVADVPNGHRIYVEYGGMIVVVFNIAGKYFATGDVCSHDNGTIGDGELDGFQIICPRHGARFDIRDGKALSLPAVHDIPSFPVRVIGEDIELGIPEE